MSIPKKVAIIGGTGFIGKYVAKQLVKQFPTSQVTLISRHPTLKNTTLPSSIQHVQADILDPTSLSRALNDTTDIIHLVGIMHETPPRYTFDAVQRQGAENVAMTAKQHHSRLVLVSAIGADATSSIPYAKTKGLGEEAVRKHVPDAIIFRPSLVFGKEDDFFNRFARLAKYLPFLPLLGGGHTKFQPGNMMLVHTKWLVHVQDVAQGIANALDPHYTSRLQGQMIQAGGPDIFTYKELMQLVLHHSNRWRPLIPMPWWMGRMQALVLEQFPVNLFTLTRDQVALLQVDNIVQDGLTLKDVGVTELASVKDHLDYLKEI